MCCITGLDRRVSLTALGCKSISNRGDERAFCLFRFSIKRISCLHLFPRHSRSCSESKPTFPPSTPKAKMYNANLLFISFFEEGGRGTLPVPLTKEMVTWIKHYTSLLMVFIYFFLFLNLMSVMLKNKFTSTFTYIMINYYKNIVQSFHL